MKVTYFGFILLSLVACASIRRHTYPPDFTYIEKKEISSKMWDLAVTMASLNQAMNRADDVPSIRQMEVVSLLKTMEQIGGKLDVSGTTNHPKLDQNIDQFRVDLENARKGAEKNPPNYYLAGRITGSCTHCHGLRP